MTADVSRTKARGLGPTALTLLAALGYFILIGGTSAGDVSPALKLVNAAIGASVIALYLTRLRERADRIDRLVLVALLLFASAGTLAQFSRTALDAVLGALAYTAGLFVARDLLSRPEVRRAFGRLLMGLSLLFTLVAGGLWLPSIVGWWAATDWRVAPPLGLELAAFPWGHRYDLALLLAMLYPAWWLDRPSGARRFMAVIVGIIGLGLVIATGSRTVWLALAAATALVAIPSVGELWARPRARAIVAGISVVLVIAVIVTGIGTSVAQRALSGESLDWRTAMWGPLIELWAANPIAGIGPGSFPWALQLTGYFDTRTWAPRHPDNAVMQLLPEAGLLGVLAAAVLVVAIVPAVLRGRSSAARWVVLLFTIACIGANPSDFAFLVVTIIAWVAYAAPHAPVRESSDQQRRVPSLRAAIGVAASVVAVVQSLLLAGALSYSTAVDAVARGDVPGARRSLDLAIAMDPAMALYWRQRGIANLELGDSLAAVADLRRATSLNPADDLAWRSLAIAADSAGMSALVDHAADRALALQRSDVTNLLLAAHVAESAGRSDQATTLLAEAVQSWPEIVAAPGWSALLPTGVDTSAVVDAARDRWTNGMSTPELPTDQGIWLGVLSGRDELVQAEVAAAASPRLASAVAAALRCQGGSALDDLDDATSAERRSSQYWHLRLWRASLTGTEDIAARKVLRIMTGGIPTAGAAAATLNPVNEGSALSGDVWGYRRPPILWADATVRLPSPAAGSAQWLIDPSHAAAAAGLLGRVPLCDPADWSAATRQPPG